jgi:hypothetical protein
MYSDLRLQMPRVRSGYYLYYIDNVIYIAIVKILILYGLRGYPNGNYHQKELIDRIAETTQAKRVMVKRVVQSFLDEIVAELSQDNRLSSVISASSRPDLFQPYGPEPQNTRTGSGIFQTQRQIQNGPPDEGKALSGYR